MNLNQHISNDGSPPMSSKAPNHLNHMSHSPSTSPLNTTHHHHRVATKPQPKSSGNNKYYNHHNHAQQQAFHNHSPQPHTHNKRVFHRTPPQSHQSRQSHLPPIHKQTTPPVPIHTTSHLKQHLSPSKPLSKLSSSSPSLSPSSDDEDFKHAFPIKAIAFDLDKTMVRTISLHTDEQPQPEHHPNGYFMFFDEDTKEYHHVYKRPHLSRLLDFLQSEIVAKQRCKMMMCTHGTQKYAQTILQKCKADKLFPLMLPRKDWHRRQFEDDYKPRRFKTLEKMAKSVNERVDDIIMIDDDPGVFSKADRCNGMLVHIKPFDDPYEQRNDQELNKLISFLEGVLKYGKNYYNIMLSKSIRYTGIVAGKGSMDVNEMGKHSFFRAQLLKRLLFDFEIKLNRSERLGTLFLFDRYVSVHPIEWQMLNANKTSFAYYLIVMFACMFIVRQYLYTDAKRPKQFRRDPYSAEIWLHHVEVYIRLVRKYKTMDGVNVYVPQWSGEEKKRRRNGSAAGSSGVTVAGGNGMMVMDDTQLVGAAGYPMNGMGMNGVQQVQYGTEHMQIQQQQRRSKRKHKHREKQIYFTELHNITKEICGALGYPKLLHGLFHRPQDGFDASLFVKYEKYVESLFRHIDPNYASNGL